MCIDALKASAMVILVNEGVKALRDAKLKTATY